ncbi:MgtC/SapB family protein [Fusobacterium mortiferum]|jgi:putative Mg2+ transporter-C (MgtC) family protein|uniref:MgtC/SapB family protein n=1 Tax=Fusobacterium mortiferum TaxID=850 RepID=UPI0022DFA597|nr:MgtC/SapB family protein [Fusobacterium mortiferum]MDD7262062.1 MgtC/SapB family protein [Fusobacterium mortiferum]MDY5980474.1 MgtC/SapB family protein [Fusobacterium mortiferum]
MNSSITELSLHIIILRIFLSTIIGGIIGYERGSNNQAAGFRTHILVCLGATLISLIQEQLKINLLNYAIENPLSSQVLKTDLGRLGAQVISGIGFLGAGTILREEKTIAGLTTAASVWVTGCIGLGIGWGFYRLTIITGIVVLIVLITLKKIEVIYKTIIITYTEDNNIEDDIKNTFDFFLHHNIKVKKFKKGKNSKKIIYTLILPKNLNRIKAISELTKFSNISEIQNF